MSGNDVKVTFFYEEKPIIIQSKDNEKMTKIFEDFAYKLSMNSNFSNLEFFQEGNKLSINESSKYNDIFNNKSEVTLFAKRKVRIIRCPKCICNDCIVDIDNYQLIFYDCKYDKEKNHHAIELFDNYKNTQKIDYSQIVCDISGCKKNQKDDPQDFYKCLNCSKLSYYAIYLCNKCSLEHDKTHKIIKYDEKNYYCGQHFHKFIKYCFTCRKNLCKKCVDKHKDHKVKSYFPLNVKDINESLDKIKKQIGNLGHIINGIKRNLDNAMKIYEKYYEIAKDILEKYELYNKDLQNYRILRSILNLKKSNKKIIDDLDKIISGKELKDKVITLIDTYEDDRHNYKKGNNNIVERNDDDEFKEWEEEEKKYGISDEIESKNDENKNEIQNTKEKKRTMRNKGKKNTLNKNS